MNKKNSYSTIQYFFWLLSGSEISILKKCHTDYNRHAGIGFTVFMTMVFGCFAGGYAGFYFSKNYSISIIFGLIWGLLIFSIDRSMIVTLKKDPTKSKQNYIVPLLGRSFLAILIAFIISIPLELLIFKDQIELQKLKDNVNLVIEQRKNWEKATNISADSTEIVTISQEIKTAANNIQNLRSDFKYRELDDEYNTMTEASNLLNKQYNEANTYLNNVLSIRRKRYSYDYFDKSKRGEFIKDKDYETWYRYKYNVVIPNKKEWENSVTLLKNKEIERNIRGKEYREEQELKIYKAKQLKDSTNNIMKSKNENIHKQVNEMDSLVNRNQNSFIRDFIAMEHAANAKTIVSNNSNLTTYKYENESMLFFLWLIRILFFTIEILPTICKMATPIGSYDRAIYQNEKDFEKEILEYTNLYISHKRELLEKQFKEEKRQEDIRLELEGKVHDECIKEIAKIQNNLRLEMIAKYKESKQKEIDNKYK